MANPQLEHGHLELANEIVESLARIRISGTEWQLLWVILRKTYGWRKKLDAIPLSQFQTFTGLSKPHIVRYLKKLLLKRVIFVAHKSTGIAIYGFNKDFESWQPLPKKRRESKKTEKVGHPCGQQDGHWGGRGDSNIEKGAVPDDEARQTYGCHVELTGREYERLVERLGPQSVEDIIEFFNLKIESKGVAQWRADHKSDYATILYWERNGWIIPGKGKSNQRLSASSRGIMGWAERERERMGTKGESF
jgi:phage replication O-like protein O